MNEQELKTEALAQAGFLFDKGSKPTYAQICEMVYETLGDVPYAQRYAAMIRSTMKQLYLQEAAWGEQQVASKPDGTPGTPIEGVSDSIESGTPNGVIVGSTPTYPT
jgi:hypothetical protein